MMCALAGHPRHKRGDAGTGWLTTITLRLLILIWSKTLANRYNRAKAVQAKIIQKYVENVLGLPKNTQLRVAIDAVAKATGCAPSRAAVTVAIGGVVPVADKAMKIKKPQIGKDFYDTWEWKEARFAALKRHGRQCQCCGWTPGSSAGNYLVVDHIKPLRLHPQLALDPDNHQVLCNDCNMGKSFKHHDDFR